MTRDLLLVDGLGPGRGPAEARGTVPGRTALVLLTAARVHPRPDPVGHTRGLPQVSVDVT